VTEIAELVGRAEEKGTRAGNRKWTPRWEPDDAAAKGGRVEREQRE